MSTTMRITTCALMLALIGSASPAQIFTNQVVGYFENFELGQANWTAGSSSGTTWQFGNLSFLGDPPTSGINMWRINNPSANTNSWIQATFDCTQLTQDPVLQMKINFSTGPNSDGLTVDLSTGGFFNTVGQQGDDYHWYNSNLNASGDDGWSGESLANPGESPSIYWRRVSRVLSGAAGNIVTVRIRYVSGPNSFNAGAALDDIQLTAQPKVVTPTSPSFDNFEANNGGWQTGQQSVPSTFSYGPITGPTINSAFSGSKGFATSLFSSYTHNEKTWMERTFDLRAMTEDPVLKFRLWFDTEAFWDGAHVTLDIEEEGEKVLGTVNEPGFGAWYFDPDVDGLFDGADGWSGQSGGWARVAHVLDGSAGKFVTVRIRFGADGSVIGGDGIGVDDVSVGTASPLLPGTQDDFVLHYAANGGTEYAVDNEILDRSVMGPGDVFNTRFDTSDPVFQQSGQLLILVSLTIAPSNPNQPFPGIFLGNQGAFVLTPNQSPFAVPGIPVGGYNLPIGHPGPAFTNNFAFLQGIFLNQMAANGILATTNALRIGFF